MPTEMGNLYGNKKDISMREPLKRIIEISKNIPCDLKALNCILKDNTFTEDELMRIAISAVAAYEDDDYRDVYWRIDDDGEHYRVAVKYDENYVTDVKKHNLIEVLRLLLDYGLNPNTCLHEPWPNNVFEAVTRLDTPFLAGFCTRLMLDYGANPWLEIDDNEFLFQELDADVCIDVNIQPDRMVQPLVQSWLVMVGYGARPNGSCPFVLTPGHTYEEVKEFEFFEYSVAYDREKKKNIMHITDIRTREEIGFL